MLEALGKYRVALPVLLVIGGLGAGAVVNNLRDNAQTPPEDAAVDQAAGSVAMPEKPTDAATQEADVATSSAGPKATDAPREQSVAKVASQPEAAPVEPKAAPTPELDAASNAQDPEPVEEAQPPAVPQIAEAEEVPAEPAPVIVAEQAEPEAEPAPKLETEALEVAALPATQTAPLPSTNEAASVPAAPITTPSQPVAKLREEAPEAAPEPELQLEAATAAMPASAVANVLAPQSEQGYDQRPKFDLVRVEPDGSALIAGKAPAGAIVKILSDGIELGQSRASARGEFVAFVNTAPQKDVQTLELQAETNDGPVVVSEDTVLLLAKTETASLDLPAAESAPTVVKSTPQGVSVVSAPNLATLDHVTLDTISYDAEGEVVLTGRGVPGKRVFVYADGAAVGANRVSQSGSWQMVMVGLEAGRYTLRVDEVDEDGTVTSRVESPFQRVYPEDELLLAGLTRKNVIVQPGSNLWTIARVRYGNGAKYTQIFAANRDRIRNPDLIYPGQIFDLPEDAQQ